MRDPATGFRACPLSRPFSRRLTSGRDFPEWRHSSPHAARGFHASQVLKRPHYCGAHASTRTWEPKPDAPPTPRGETLGPARSRGRERLLPRPVEDDQACRQARAEPPIVDAASPCLAVSRTPQSPAPHVTLRRPMRGEICTARCESEEHRRVPAQLSGDGTHRS